MTVFSISSHSLMWEARTTRKVWQ